jgi:hypothetical protein
MKLAFTFTALTVLLPALLLLGAGSPGIHQPAAIAAQDTSSSLSDETLIEPGAHVGPLKLGDTRARALELFPKKAEDQEWQNTCGTTLDWVDSANPNGKGDLSIRLKKDKVFQIESATTRFHTIEGITTFDHPEKVAHAYRDLHAFTLLTPPNSALGDRPLVFWVDKKKGIAFAFAYYPAEHKRYVYKIIIFEPNKTFCPEEETTGSPKWQQIPSYSIEPPADLALNRFSNRESHWPPATGN